MKTNAISQQPAQQQKTKNKGIIRASLAKTAVAIPLSIACPQILKGMQKVSTLNESDTFQLSKASQKALETTGLKDKGVQIHKLIDFEPKTAKTAEEMFENFENLTNYSESEQGALKAAVKAIKSSKIFKFAEKQLQKLYPNREILKEEMEQGAEIGAKIGILSQVKTGKNAFYLPEAISIITPTSKFQTSVFHEMGHALNDNGGIILKSLQKIRPLAKFAPAIIFAISILNKRKTTDEKLENNTTKNKIQNGFDFIKKNAGKLTALSMLPMVLEEGIATLRGDKIARELVKSGDLTKDLLKKVRLTNLGGFSTYALALIAAVAGVKTAIRVKDTIQEQYENKLSQNRFEDRINTKLEAHQG